MPRINLLPVRALARLEQAKQELTLTGLGLLALLAAVVAVQQAGARSLAQLAERSAAAEQTLRTLADQAAQTERLRGQANALKVKLAAIERLRGQKQEVAPLLAFFADVLAELPRVWLTQLAQQGEVVTLEGGAMTQGDVSAFQLALADRRPAFRNVALALVSTAHQAGGGADYLQWTITCLAPKAEGADASAPQDAAAAGGGR